MPGASWPSARTGRLYHKNNSSGHVLHLGSPIILYIIRNSSSGHVLHPGSPIPRPNLSESNSHSVVQPACASLLHCTRCSGRSMRSCGHTLPYTAKKETRMQRIYRLQAPTHANSALPASARNRGTAQHLREIARWRCGQHCTHVLLRPGIHITSIPKETRKHGNIYAIKFPVFWDRYITWPLLTFIAKSKKHAMRRVACAAWQQRNTLKLLQKVSL